RVHRCHVAGGGADLYEPHPASERAGRSHYRRTAHVVAACDYRNALARPLVRVRRDARNVVAYERGIHENGKIGRQRAKPDIEDDNFTAPVTGNETAALAAAEADREISGNAFLSSAASRIDACRQIECNHCRTATTGAS